MCLHQLCTGPRKMKEIEDSFTVGLFTYFFGDEHKLAGRRQDLPCLDTRVTQISDSRYRS